MPHSAITPPDVGLNSEPVVAAPPTGSLASDLPDAPDTPDAPDAPDDLAVIRDLLCRVYPDAVPGLIAGETTADLLASVEPARAAARVAYERIQATTAPTYSPPASVVSPPSIPVPAGGGAALPIDPDRLPASEKIRRGLARERLHQRS
jgi:hypothetical protein